MASSKTIVTSANAYASPTDLINAYSAGRIGDFVKDDNVQATPSQLPTNAAVLAALLRASGEVETACFKGGRYSPDDLNALTGASQAALKGLVCDIAYFRLARRKKHDTSADPIYKECQETLKALANGETIFGFQQAADAGNMSTADLSQNSQGVLQRVTEKMPRRFGVRLDGLSSDPFRGHT